MSTIESISYWERASLLACYDCIIIGAGFVGLSSAIYLQKANPRWKIAILERGVISYGASTRNAGFACFGSIGELEEDRRTMPVNEIVDLVNQRWQGLQHLCQLIDPTKMDYHNLGGTELFDNEKSFLSSSAQVNFWNEALENVVGEQVFQIVDQPHKGFYHRAIFNKYEGQLNPALAIQQLYAKCREQNIAIFNGVEVDSWKKNGSDIVVSTSVKIDFNTTRLAFATNAFTPKLLSDVQVHPARNQVLITKSFSSNWKGCYHFNKGYIYFRTVDDRILLGGARYLSEAENTDEYGNTATIQDFLTSFLRERIANDTEVEIEHWWSGILGIGDKKSPIIAKYSDQIYLAVRLGGMGVAIGTSVGKELAEFIVND